MEFREFEVWVAVMAQREEGRKLVEDEAVERVAHL